MSWEKLQWGTQFDFLIDFFQHVATALPTQEAFEIEVGNQLFLPYDIEKESYLALVYLGNDHWFYKLHNYEVF